MNDGSKNTDSKQIDEGENNVCVRNRINRMIKILITCCSIS